MAVLIEELNVDIPYGIIVFCILESKKDLSNIGYICCFCIAQKFEASITQLVLILNVVQIGGNCSPGYIEMLQHICV